jgi:hypothetical protein
LIVNTALGLYSEQREEAQIKTSRGGINAAAQQRLYYSALRKNLGGHSHMMASPAALVVDSGSGMIKAGRCGQELPEVVFPSCVGRPKHHRVMASALEADALMGSDVQKHRGVCSLKYPCHRGVVQDWDDMQKVWGQVFRDLRVQPDEQAILFTESPLVSTAQASMRGYLRCRTFCSRATSAQKNSRNYV